MAISRPWNRVIVLSKVKLNTWLAKTLSFFSNRGSEFLFINS